MLGLETQIAREEPIVDRGYIYIFNGRFGTIAFFYRPKTHKSTLVNPQFQHKQRNSRCQAVAMSRAGFSFARRRSQPRSVLSPIPMTVDDEHGRTGDKCDAWLTWKIPSPICLQIARIELCDTARAETMVEVFGSWK